jgi:hypothetical protein
MVENLSGHLTTEILHEFGYEGADWKSKLKFKELLDRNNVIRICSRIKFDYIKIDFLLQNTQ